jgi:hypothetical protein
MARKAIDITYELSATVMTLDRRIAEMQEDNRRLIAQVFELETELAMQVEAHKKIEAKLQEDVIFLSRRLTDEMNITIPAGESKKNASRAED